MNGRLPSKTTTARASYYRIKVRGTLEPYWSNRLGGLNLESKSGTTTLTGRIMDQAALHGLITQIRDLGMPLLLVEEINERQLLEDSAEVGNKENLDE